MVSGQLVKDTFFSLFFQNILIHGALKKTENVSLKGSLCSNLEKKNGLISEIFNAVL